MPRGAENKQTNEGNGMPHVFGEINCSPENQSLVGQVMSQRY